MGTSERERHFYSLNGGPAIMTFKVLCINSNRATIAEFGKGGRLTRRREFEVFEPIHLLRVVVADRPDAIVWDKSLTSIDAAAFLKKVAGALPADEQPLMIIGSLASGATSRGARAEGRRDTIVEFSGVLRTVLAHLQTGLQESHVNIMAGNGICLDPVSREVTRFGRKVNLGPTEVRLLEELMREPGQVHSRRDLVERVWDGRPDIDDRTVDVYVGRLRRALVRGKEASPIRTQRGRGYLFEPSATS
ncbi:MAG: winged helix-turn-helix domain-containing protein [Deltaproteobacteria bacterium]